MKGEMEMRVFTMLFVVIMLSLVVSPTLYAKKPIGRDSVWSTFGTDIYYNDGNVGIGTTNPVSELDVNGEVVIWNNASASAFELSFFGTDGTDIRSQSQMLIRPIGYMLLMPGDTESVMLTTDGKVGIGEMNPSYPLEMGSGAHVTTGGVWTNASSRDYKENIKTLSTENALEVFKALTPVTFNYKTDKSEEYVGFIAEDVPELVATKDRKGLSPMDIVGVLTKVVQEQQQELKTQLEANKALEERLVKLEARLSEI